MPQYPVDLAMPDWKYGSRNFVRSPLCTYSQVGSTAVRAVWPLVGGGMCGGRVEWERESGSHRSIGSSSARAGRQSAQAASHRPVTLHATALLCTRGRKQGHAGRPPSAPAR